MNRPTGARANALNQNFAVVGSGRLGTALFRSLEAAGLKVTGPHGRGYRAVAEQVVLLCVPDSEIPNAAACVVPEAIVAHCSGATPLSALGDRASFSLHPLMTVPSGNASLVGATCAVTATDKELLNLAMQLGSALQMNSIVLDDADRTAYHAAASIASNYLHTVLDIAESTAESVNVDRTAYAKLAHAAIDSWVKMGAQQALTGPIARGDEVTVARQRKAVQEAVSNDQLELFDSLTKATRKLTTRRDEAVNELRGSQLDAAS